MTDEKNTITITGTVWYQQRLLARFFAQELRRAIGSNETSLSIDGVNEAELGKRVHDEEIREALQDRPIALSIPAPARVVSYDLNSNGEPAFLTMHFSGIGEHSFRGRAKKVAQELRVMGAIGESVKIVGVGADHDAVVICAAAVGRPTLDEMKAEIEQYVRQRLLDD